MGFLPGWVREPAAELTRSAGSSATTLPWNRDKQDRARACFSRRNRHSRRRRRTEVPLRRAARSRALPLAPLVDPVAERRAKGEWPWAYAGLTGAAVTEASGRAVAWAGDS